MKMKQALPVSKQVQAQILPLYLRYILNGFFLLGALIAFSLSAYAQDSAEKIYDYKVYAGGINAVDAQLRLEQTDKYFETELKAITRGFIGKIAPWEGVYFTKGFFNQADQARPQTHIAQSTWRGDTEIKTFHYDNKGRFESLTIVEKGKDKTPDDIDAKLAQNSVDLLSAMLNVMNTSVQSNECSGSFNVFDGKRRFKLWFKPLGRETLSKSKYSAYAGPALKCEVEIFPDGGRWHEKPRGWLSIQEQGRDKGALPLIWLAKVGESEHVIPVKMQVKTDYGVLFMHLVN